MNPAATIRAIGGVIVDDVGRIGLTDARAMAKVYANLVGEFAEGSHLARFCRERSGAYARAAEDAASWRRAGGWTRPEQADQA